MLEQYVVASSSGKKKPGREDRDRLPEEVPLAIGMQIIVTLNIQTELDLANGARSTITGMVLDPNEPEFESTAPVVRLKRLPLYILVKMPQHTRAMTLPGLDPMPPPPIVPASKGFKITMDIRARNGRVERVPKTVRRSQFPITPAYAFTDYRAQGQTIESVIVNITAPPDGGQLSLANFSGRETIRILRDFSEKLLAQPLDPDLAADDERLE
ncbi:hypothetical protein FRC10_003726 [Ceratobasidium sp. 414]|nr:hypothetical protein FRC10_003726 [Ceratobasidium sp. 414]